MLASNLGGAMTAFGMLLFASVARGQAFDDSATGSTPRADVIAIRRTLSEYEAALNASSVNSVMPLYTDDGVFMPPQSASAVGRSAVRAAYEAVFKTITLHVKFDVVEVVEMSPDWAFARTNSAGTVTVHATGAQSAEANQELFIFHKSGDAQWRIARYSFSPTS